MSNNIVSPVDVMKFFEWIDSSNVVSGWRAAGKSVSETEACVTKMISLYSWFHSHHLHVDYMEFDNIKIEFSPTCYCWYDGEEYWYYRADRPSSFDDMIWFVDQIKQICEGNLYD